MVAKSDPEETLTARRPWISSYGHDTPVTVPLPRLPLYDFLASAADNMPQRPAILFYGHRLNYARLHQASMRFANALRDLGMQPGERVMIVLPDIRPWSRPFTARWPPGAWPCCPIPCRRSIGSNARRRRWPLWCWSRCAIFRDWPPACVASPASAR